jgi:hypothetical protein
MAIARGPDEGRSPDDTSSTRTAMPLEPIAPEPPPPTNPSSLEAAPAFRVPLTVSPLSSRSPRSRFRRRQPPFRSCRRRDSSTPWTRFSPIATPPRNPRRSVSNGPRTPRPTTGICFDATIATWAPRYALSLSAHLHSAPSSARPISWRPSYRCTRCGGASSNALPTGLRSRCATSRRPIDSPPCALTSLVGTINRRIISSDH